MQCGGRTHQISCTKQVLLTIHFQNLWLYFHFNFFQFFSAFSQKDSIETYTSDWTYTTIGISQRSLFITFIFLVFAADIMTLEEHIQTDEICSKYAVWILENSNRQLPPVNTNIICYSESPDLVHKRWQISEHVPWKKTFFCRNVGNWMWLIFPHICWYCFIVIFFNTLKKWHFNFKFGLYYNNFFHENFMIKNSLLICPTTNLFSALFKTELSRVRFL